MKVSLVLATVDRTNDLPRLFESLTAQEVDLELLVVDQNPDNRVARLLEEYTQRLNIVHLRGPRGLSRARNLGLRHAKGTLVGFPDDDCWYPPGLLSRVCDFFATRPEVDVLTGRFCDEDGLEARAWPRTELLVNRFNVWRAAISISIFMRTDVAQRVGRFDETLGIGSGTRWGAGEETDYLLRALAQGATIVYRPEIVLGHPVKFTGSKLSSSTLKRIEMDAAGRARVLRKNGYPYWYRSLFLAKSSASLLYSVARANRTQQRLHLSALRGKLVGLLERP